RCCSLESGAFPSTAQFSCKTPRPPPSASGSRTCSSLPTSINAPLITLNCLQPSRPPSAKSWMSRQQPDCQRHAMNPDLDRLQPYPFEKLAQLKQDCQPPAGLSDRK